MKKNITRALSLLLVLVMVLGVMPVALADDAAAPSVSLTADESTYTEGETVYMTLRAEAVEGYTLTSVTGSPATTYTVSGNTATATYPAQKGEWSLSATATFTTPDGGTVTASDTVTVTVVPEATGLDLAVNKSAIAVGETASLTITAEPEGALVPSNVRLDYDSDVISISGGTITGLKVGTATIKTAAGELPSNTVSIEVTKKQVKLTGGTPTMTIAVGEEKYMGVAMSPADAPAEITYGSSDPTVATVDADGKITGVKADTVDITATLKLLDSTEYELGAPVTYVTKVTVTNDAYIKCDNVSTSGSSVTLRPVLYVNGKSVDADFDAGLVSGPSNTEVDVHNNDNIDVDSGKYGIARVRITVDGGDHDGVSKDVYVSFYDTETMEVVLKDSVSTFKFSDTSKFSSASYGYSDTTMSVTGKSMEALIWSKLPYSGSGDNVADSLALTVGRNSGGELTVSGSRPSDYKSDYVIKESQLDTVTFKQTSSTNNITTFTVEGLDGDLVTGQLTVEIVAGEVSGIEYSTSYNKSVNFSVADFREYWEDNAENGNSDLSHVYFEVSSRVPSYGTLYANTSKSKEVTASMKFIASGTASGSNTYSLSGVTYEPYASSTAQYSVEIPFVAYGTKNDSVSGVVIININEQGNTIGARGVTLGDDVAKSIADSYYDATKNDLGYVIFDLPSAQYGTIYRSIPKVGGYSRVTEAQRVITNDKFYYTSKTSVTKPSGYAGDLADVTLVPAAGYSGKITLSYEAYNTSGKGQKSGYITYDVQTKTASAVFNDVTAKNYSWASGAVDFLYYEGTAQGSNGKYNPAANITRGDFMLMLYRAFLEEDYGTYQVTSNFNDMVKGNTTYSQETYQAVGVAKYLGIAQGTNDKFNPKANITREEAMVLIYRTLEKLNRSLRYTSSSKASYFNDFSSISSWATTAISDLVSHGVIQGSNNRITPKANITRAEMACILHRVITY